ncbi:hypothetical protein FXO38_14750 [Capsicum annuum]|nr:hypothetical protein FXO38_14750 [Capsicum annuum]
MGPEMVQGVFSNRGNGHQKMRILDQVLTSKDKDHHSSSPVKENFHDSSQKLEDEYRLIHYKDEMDDSKLDHIGDADDNFNDVFDPGDQEEYAMEVAQLARQQGLYPRGSLLKDKKGIKHAMSSRAGHTTRPFTRSHIHKTAK